MALRQMLECHISQQPGRILIKLNALVRLL
jgi:hypothetical protein